MVQLKLVGPEQQEKAGTDETNGACESNHTAQVARAAEVLGNSQRLSEFYRNKTILITGVTGFIGKVCLVKLLHALAVWDRIYVVLRTKRGESAQKRLDTMLQQEPFKSLTCTTDGRPLDWTRVQAVEGDMSKEDLGLDEAVKEHVLANTEIIFNIAASVSFDAPLKQNLRDNYMGARNMLHLAEKCRKLVSLVHVSTFFTNSHIKHVEERVLPLEKDCEKLAELITWLPDSLCDTVAPHVMENRPNTYIFTKAMAENLVQSYNGRLPIAIVRPSIVTPAYKDPVPGWVDNVNGPMGLGVLASLGILRNIDWNYYGVADFIPVDYVVNSMLAVAERTARLYPRQIKVYNCSTSSLNPVTWGQGFEEMRKESFKAPPYKMLRIPIKVPRHKRANRIHFALTKFSEILFAYFIDFILTLCCQRRILVKLTNKLHHGYKILLPFTSTEYTCSNDNLLAAYDELHPDDKSLFNFDILQLDWQKAFIDSYHGARRRLLKEDLSNVPAALFKMRLLRVGETCFSLLFYASLLWFTSKFVLTLGGPPLAMTANASQLN